MSEESIGGKVIENPGNKEIRRERKYSIIYPLQRGKRARLREREVVRK